jgi:glycosyltransferase involved in cell wall biosynthesis
MVRSDSHLRTDRGLLKPIAKWPLYRWFIPKLDACLAAGQWSKDYFVHYGARAERVFIVPHCVDTEYFRNASAQLKEQRPELRESWGLDTGAVVFLFVGKFIDKKRPMDFIRGVESASHRGNSIMGLMVGDGPLYQACEKYVAERRVPVRFTGFLNQSEITRAYVAADALVLPSDGGETWGMVVNEAMACGLPCLVSDEVGCGPDLILSQDTGAVFPLGDIKSLSERLLALASDASLICRLGRNAQQKSDTFSVHASARSIVDAIGVCLGRS